MSNTVDKVLHIALDEVGYLEKRSNSRLYSKTENAGSANYTKYGKEMHDLSPSVMDFPAPWCDAFVDWCFYKAYGLNNAKALLGGNFNDYTPASAQLYHTKNAWHTSDPKPGDQIFFKNNTRIYHTGLVYQVDPVYVYTIEGNTSGASGVIANGGGVCKKKYRRNSSKIAGYGRPDYDSDKAYHASDKQITSADDSHIQFIKDVQTAIGANVDGIVGKETLSKTVTVSKTKNRTHAVIKPIQKYLNFLGYPCGIEDGIAGNKFHHAVMAYQKAMGCIVDGEITAQNRTWKQLLGM